MIDTPNPGSDAAYELGCICARMDNNRGKYSPWPPDGWWITGGCPVHAPGHSEPIEDDDIAYCKTRASDTVKT